MAFTESDGQRPGAVYYPQNNTFYIPPYRAPAYGGQWGSFHPNWNPAPARSYAPPARRSYGGSTGSAHFAGSSSGRAPAAPAPGPPTRPAPSPFDPFPGPAVDLAKNYVDSVMKLMGYPAGTDTQGMALWLLRNNQLGHKDWAIEQMWTNFFSDAQKNANPWGRYNMDASSYLQRKQVIDTAFRNTLGYVPDHPVIGGTAPTGLGNLGNMWIQAMRDNWDQSSLMSELQKNNEITGLQPWLVAGTTFQSASQSYQSIYGTAPVDTKTLAGWWHFNAGAGQLTRTAREAVGQAGATIKETAVR